MKRILVAYVCIALLAPAFLLGEEKVIVVSERVGEEIDAEEAKRFGLSIPVEGFKKLVFIEPTEGRYFVEITYEEDGEEKIMRTEQSKASIESMRYRIDNYGAEEKVETDTKEKEILMTEKVLSESTKSRELITIHEELGKAIDEEEREQYKLFHDVKDFKKAAFYRINNTTYEVEFITERDILISVIRDPVFAIVMQDYIKRFDEVVGNRIAFEKKWEIVSYDALGFAITKHEINAAKRRANKQLGLCLVGGCLPVLALSGHLWSDPFLSDKEASNRPYLACILGSAGVAVIATITSRNLENTTIPKIKKSREAKVKKSK